LRPAHLSRSLLFSPNLLLLLGLVGLPLFSMPLR
jgi:hypothetical protein